MTYKNILIVLGCGPLPDGRPSPGMKNRVAKAVELYRKNRYSKVIMTGGPTTFPVPESEMMRLLALKNIPDSKIITEKNSKSTIQNAVFTWELIKDNKPKNITVVTSAFHIPRTRYIFRKLYAHMGVSMKFIAAPDHVTGFDAFYLRLRERIALFDLKMRGFRDLKDIK